MSKSLVRKSLEFDELSLRPDKKKKKRQDALYDGALALVPARHRFTSEDDKTVVNTILGRSSKLTIHEVKKRLAAQKDPTEKNVQQLLLLNTNHLKSEVSDKLLQRAVKKKHIRKQEKSKDKLDKPEETAFTEEDFKKFEQEYIE